jgi:uncharacterized protein YegL
MRPGGELAHRPLHFIWITDCSGSMSVDGKVQALNNAIRETLPHMRRVADDNPNAQVLVRALAFSTGAWWHVERPTPVEEFRWADLSADGVTDLGQAMLLAAEALRFPEGERGLVPVLVLVSDGQPTDDYKAGLNALLAEPWGLKAVRIAIAIGRDADTEVLQQFIANPELRPLQANRPDDLVHYIRWASTAVLKRASTPVVAQEEQGAALPMPEVPRVVPGAPGQDITW